MRRFFLIFLIIVKMTIKEKKNTVIANKMKHTQPDLPGT